ncbi:hypothetical protein G3I40_35155 [Streptomyces sp. SID14478]|uniref:hypothetical protein n=1 Tax=Streptomyces sp. SID14478 TaxID=2706073 RepID=UPI0013DF7BB7|nr:hypothetical protein [Streptomyces sp. SID14478]NEB80411.1 hypothetical protein [Streptomyces sp. SID14478]
MVSVGLGDLHSLIAEPPEDRTVPSPSPVRGRRRCGTARGRAALFVVVRRRKAAYL